MGFPSLTVHKPLGSIAAFFASNPQPLPEGYVFLKLISLQRSPDERTFAQRITQSTNFQNQIGLRVSSLRSMRSKSVLLPDRSTAFWGPASLQRQCRYLHRRMLQTSRWKKPSTALACLEYDPECDFCARVLSHRSSLWSLEPVFPETAEIRSRYRRLFRPDRSARTVWRAVQARRAVVERMQENTRASTGTQRVFRKCSLAGAPSGCSTPPS